MEIEQHNPAKTDDKVLQPVIGSRHQRSIIYLEGVTVDFDGFKALNNLNLVVDYHELRVVIGPNGAGKSTLLDAISGKVQPASGRIVFGQGTDLIGLRENEITALGIGRKFQTPLVYTTLPVWDNLDLSLRRSSKGYTKGHDGHIFGSKSLIGEFFVERHVAIAVNCTDHRSITPA